MKLLYCTACQDMVRLTDTPRTCECGDTGGQYVTDSEVEIFGGGVPVGILNADFNKAITQQTDDWPGVWFGGFVIPKFAENVIHVSRS